MVSFNNITVEIWAAPVKAWWSHLNWVFPLFIAQKRCAKDHNVSKIKKITIKRQTNKWHSSLLNTYKYKQMVKYKDIFGLEKVIKQEKKMQS